MSEKDSNYVTTESAGLVNGITDDDKIQIIIDDADAGSKRDVLRDKVVSNDSDIQDIHNIAFASHILPEGERVTVNQFTGDIHDEERAQHMFLSDGVRRIDFILVWTVPLEHPGREQKQRDKERAEARSIFEQNLRSEAGLVLEHDVEEGREEQYTKVHAPWNVLTVYAELMKLRMPIKERPDEVGSVNLWDELSKRCLKLLHPFQLDPLRVPILPKRYTAIFDRSKEYLFAIPKDRDCFFSHTTRSRIVEYILRKTKYADMSRDLFRLGINRLLANGTYLASYPLHEGSWKPSSKPSIRKLLYKNWASWGAWYKIQPLQYIRLYFGEKIGLYFAWIGYYSYSLVPVSFVGLLVFIYGIIASYSDAVAMQSCDKNNTFIMCPQCNKRCGYWNYYNICPYIHATHMFDNGATVFFAIFMSLWGTFYLEFWKREEAGIQFLWDVASFDGEEEPPRPEYLTRRENSKHKKIHKTSGETEPYYPFWRRQVPVYLTSTSVLLFLVLMAVATVIGVVMYRISVLAALRASDNPLLYRKAPPFVSASAAVINLIIIFILTIVYTKVATWLTDWECQRTQSEYDNSLTIKLYTLQFINLYASLFYIAFFKGRFVGTPNEYSTLLRGRQEECPGGNCLTELCIQLAIIFVGKQLAQNIVEVYLPRIKRLIKRWCYKSDEVTDPLKPWEKDYMLVQLGPLGLFSEYLEMMIQFGFVTLFVAAFPLAPLFALVNNIIELRGDANKFLVQYRRTMTARARTIGVWYDILYGISRLAIVTNALIIAFTSSFIKRLVYKVKFGTMDGYVNNSLSYFNVSEFNPEVGPQSDEITEEFNQTVYCRYPGYREPPWSENKYEFSTQYWHIVAAQFLFVVVFENFIVLATSLIAYLIPDMPKKLEEQMRRQTVIGNAIILETELRRARRQDDLISDEDMNDLRHRAFGPDDTYDATEEKNAFRMAATRLANGGDVANDNRNETSEL